MTLQGLYQLTQDNILYDVGYDVFKVILGLIFAKLIYDKIFMKIWWGGWKIRVQNGPDKIYFTRNISPVVAKRIMSDGADFSVFVKGVASTIFWVNQKDMSLENVNDTKLLQLDRGKKLIIIDEAHNPPGNQNPPVNKISNKQLLEKLEEIEQKIEKLKV